MEAHEREMSGKDATYDAEPGTASGVVDANVVKAALEDPRWDFRTIDGLAHALGLPADAIRAVLAARTDLARKSVMTDRHGRELYTSAGRKMKARERLEQLRWLLAH
jgi:hypothetical protein